MKLTKESHAKSDRVKGSKGGVDMIDIVSGTPTIGVRVIEPHSVVPRHPHHHPERQVIYVIEGHCSITNNITTIDLQPGDFVELEPNEEHYVKTFSDEAKIFEVRY